MNLSPWKIFLTVIGLGIDDCLARFLFGDLNIPTIGNFIQGTVEMPTNLWTWIGFIAYVLIAIAVVKFAFFSENKKRKPKALYFRELVNLAYESKLFEIFEKVGKNEIATLRIPRMEENAFLNNFLRIQDANFKEMRLHGNIKTIISQKIMKAIESKKLKSQNPSKILEEQTFLKKDFEKWLANEIFLEESKQNQIDALLFNHPRKNPLSL